MTAREPRLRSSSPTMARRRFAAILLGLLCLSGCRSVKDQGFVYMVDDSYGASVIGTNKTGFVAPDGLLWHKGSLYLADEGGRAFRDWDLAGAVRTLGDARAGFESPEDLVM